MTKKLIVFLILITGDVAFGGSKAQQQPAKDPQAVAIVQNALGALGGDAGIAQVKDSTITGTSSPAKGSEVQPASFVWKTSGVEFRYEKQRDSGTVVFASGHGKPAILRNKQVKAVFYHVAQGAPPFHLSALVLSPQLSDPNYTLVNGGTKVVLGKNALVVQTSLALSDVDSAATLQTWYLDETTGLPVRVEYRLPEVSDMATWTDAATDFSDYRQIGPLLVPYSMTYSESGVPLETYTVDKVDFNLGIDPSEFDLLGGGQ